MERITDKQLIAAGQVLQQIEPKDATIEESSRAISQVAEILGIQQFKSLEEFNEFLCDPDSTFTF